MFELLDIAEWIIFDYGNWRIKDNAPEEAKTIFYNFKKSYDEARAQGKIVE